MSIREYIEQRFQTFGIELSEADILDISLSNGFDCNHEICSENHAPVTVAIIEWIPNLLLSPTSFTENKLSINWNEKETSIKNWYAVKCSEYGLEDKLSDKPTITFW